MVPVAQATVADVYTRVALIQALIPMGLEAFHAELQRELVNLVGERYARTGRQPCRACATDDTIARCR